MTYNTHPHTQGWREIQSRQQKESTTQWFNTTILVGTTAALLYAFSSAVMAHAEEQREMPTRLEQIMPDEMWWGVAGAVYHTNRSKDLNETPNWLSARAAWHMNQTVDAGIMLDTFKNSVNKRTTAVGPFIEAAVVQDINYVLDNVGIGLTVQYQLQEGYDIPFLPLPYAYVEFQKFTFKKFGVGAGNRELSITPRVNMSYICDCSIDETTRSDEAVVGNLELHGEF